MTDLGDIGKTATILSRRRSAGGAVCAFFLFFLLAAGCSFFEDEKDRLPGERISVLSEEESIGPDPAAAKILVRLPRPWLNPRWSQAGGSSTHVMGHLAAPGGLKILWSEGAGEEISSEFRILSTPIVADGRVFTMDVESVVMSFDADTGEKLWEKDITPEGEGWFSVEDSESVLDKWLVGPLGKGLFLFEDSESMGGGLAHENGRLFVTTGFAQVVALDAEDGEELWRQSLPGPMRASPTVADGRIFVVTLDNQLFALDEENGGRLWSHSGMVEAAGLLGAASPAVAKDVVVVPYSSGEIYALRVSNGRPLWNETLGTVKKLDMVSSLADIRGHPIIDGDYIYAISHAGHMVALDLRTGLRVWEKNIGGIQSPWVAGDFIYVLTGDARLVCLTKKDGLAVWAGRLQRYEDMEDLEDLIVWVGPLLASDRLIVAGSHGIALTISPYTGDLLGRREMPDPITVPPIVADGTVYFLTDDAELIALR